MTDSNILRLAAIWMRERSGGQDDVADLLDLAADYPEIQDEFTVLFARNYLGEILT